MVGLKSEIFAFIAENFTVEMLLQNLSTTLYLTSILLQMRGMIEQYDENVNDDNVPQME